MSKELRDALKSLTKPNNDGYSKVCTVDSVDLVNRTCYCIPVNEDADITEVRLMANIDNGFLLIPEVDSIVVVSFLSDSSAYVSMVSKVSEIQLNGTNYGGLIIVAELTDKLNNLENAFNQHLTLYNLHTHAGVTSGSSTTSPVVVQDTQTLTPTIEADLENTTVLHGDGN
jgi:hypothetical protein